MSNVKYQFHVQKRLIDGANLQVLRSQQLVPGNIYGLRQPSQAIALQLKEIASYLKDSEGGLVYLVAEDKSTTPALVDDVARHPVSGDLQHVVFRRVSLKEAVTSEVAIELVGENDVPETTVVQVVDSVEVESLPTDIPESLEVDISTLTEPGQVVTFAQLQLPKGVALVLEEERMADPVVLLQEFKEEVEEVVVEETQVEAGSEGEEQPDESAPADEKQS